MSTSAGSAEFVSSRYQDPEYQKEHINLFSKSIMNPIEHILPPGVNQASYNDAMAEWSDVVGERFVYRQDQVEEYIDPYELNEDVPLRKVPSGAVWCVEQIPPGF